MVRLMLGTSSDSSQEICKAQQRDAVQRYWEHLETEERIFPVSEAALSHIIKSALHTVTQETLL